MILTTEEAADMLGVSPDAVRKLVERGRLVPLVPGARPLRFALLDVADVQVARMTDAAVVRLDDLAARLFASG